MAWANAQTLEFNSFTDKNLEGSWKFEWTLNRKITADNQPGSPTICLLSVMLSPEKYLLFCMHAKTRGNDSKSSPKLAARGANNMQWELWISQNFYFLLSTINIIIWYRRKTTYFFILFSDEFLMIKYFRNFLAITESIVGRWLEISTSALLMACL